MDVLTSRHGLAAIKPLMSAAGVDLSLISPELQQEVKRLEEEFTVSTDRLKEIVKQFQEELEQGTSRSVSLLRLG